MAISVHLDSLAADGAALADCQAAVSAPGCEPASAHSTSQGVAANFTARSAWLGFRINHGQQVRSDGGAAVQSAAATLSAADENGAAAIAGNASASEAVSTPMTAAAVPDPVLPEIPPLLPPAPMPGEAHAAALHSGHGSEPLRVFADHWKSQAATLQNIATDTARTSASIDANWSSDHGQQAGANTAKHSTWWSDLADYASTLASAANEAADNHDRAVAATPTPDKFQKAHDRLAQAIQANAASHGMLSAQVSAAAAHLAQLQAQATEAAGMYYSSSAATTGSIPGTPAPAPAIANGGGTGAPGGQCGTGNPNQNTGGALSAQPGVTSGLTTAGTSAGTGASNNQMDQGLQSMLPMLSMLPMMAMAPMSALSGLSGMSQNNGSSMAAAAGLPGAVMADPGLAGDLADTMPAGGGGGGADATAGVAQALPMSSPTGPTAPAPPTGSGPATSVGISAEAAGTTPASAAGGGMSTYPPMMGGQGLGDAGPQRNVRLFPDRRMVWRPMPNTEAVFGELQRERRPRSKRAKPESTPEEGTHEG